MTAAFDHIAAGYDTEFTHSPIGRLQRDCVWEYIHTAFPGNFPKSVLELNCGTGEDAVFFATHGSKVLATDISPRMLEMARKKIGDLQLGDRVMTRQADLTRIEMALPEEKYDLVFSNFGGLNCIDEQNLGSLFDQLAGKLHDGGRLILVVMPRFCAWESLYFLSRLRFGKAFRRRTRKLQLADIGGSKQGVWYYDPSDINRLSARHFNIVHIQPIGIAVPPSYFKKTFLNRRTILQKLDAAEHKLNKFKQLAGISDHYLIDLELK